MPQLTIIARPSSCCGQVAESENPARFFENTELLTDWHGTAGMVRPPDGAIQHKSRPLQDTGVSGDRSYRPLVTTYRRPHTHHTPLFTGASTFLR